MQLSLLLLELHMDLETDQLHLTYQIYKVNLLRERVVILIALVIVLELKVVKILLHLQRVKYHHTNTTQTLMEDM